MDDLTTTVERLENATTCARNGDFETAITLLKEILTFSPGHEIALGMLSAIYLQIGLHDRAILLFTELLEVNPENPLARFQLGMAQFTAGDAQRALETWQNLLQQEEEFMAHFHSGLALLQLERPDAAKPLFEKAMQNMPQSHPLHSQLIEILSALEGPGSL